MRRFLLLMAGLFILWAAKAQTNIIFPRAFAFAVDDLGWNIGTDDGDVDGVGPYRIGLDKRMTVDDYKPIVEVGKAVGTRIQCLFVIAEMDRLNILRKHPSTTWLGAQWDNSKNISPEQIRIMDFVKQNAAYMEFGLHGVGHEHWVNGKKVRAEWYDLEHDRPWAKDTILAHIKCFKAIMAQYGLTPENHQRFPESYVPCAYGIYWNPQSDSSTGALLSQAGVKYGNTDFSWVKELNPPQGDNAGGFDHGMLVINRLNYGNEWWRLSALPTVPLEEQKSDIIETHWTNWLAQDKFLQPKTTKAFIEYYQMVQKSKDRYVAKNTEQLYSQWLYKKYAKVKQVGKGKVLIDNTAMPEQAYKYDILGVMVLKLPIQNGQHVQAKINGKPIPAYFEQFGWAYLYLPRLERQKYTLTYKITDKLPAYTVYNDGTYNVYQVEKQDGKLVIDLEMYGTQPVKVILPQKPKSVQSDSQYLKVRNYAYDSGAGILTITVSGVDIQGERGKLIISL